MALYKCQMCGGELIKNQDGTYECLSCGTVQTVEVNKKLTSKDNSDVVPIEIYESTYISAKKALEEADFENAAKLFARIGDYRDSTEKLSQCQSAIDEKQRAKIYECAYRIMASASTEKEYMNACNLFAKIEDYKDASIFKSSCSSAAEQCRMNEVYEKACSLAENQSIHFLSRAVELFNSIPNYKDSVQKRDLCLTSINQQQKEIFERNAALLSKTRKQEKQRKKKKVIIIISIVCLIVLIIGITKIVHNVNRIDISITDVSSKNDNKYYYVYTDFTINNQTGATIDYLEVTTYFKDSKGKTVGTMTSTFGSSYGNSTLNLKAHKKTIEETYLSEWYSSSSMSDLFVTLYNNGIDGLTITYEITYVKWSDGHTYRR